MLTLSGCIVYRTEEAQRQWKWTKACYLESTVRVIHILPVGFVSLVFHVYFLFCCLLITFPHIFLLHCLFVLRWRLVLVFLIALERWEWILAQLALSSQLSCVKSRLHYRRPAITPEGWYEFDWACQSLQWWARIALFSVQKQSLASNVFLDSVCCNAWLVNVHNIYLCVYMHMHRCTHTNDYN